MSVSSNLDAGVDPKQVYRKSEYKTQIIEKEGHVHLFARHKLIIMLTGLSPISSSDSWSKKDLNELVGA